MLDYENASADADIRFERVGDVLTIKVPREGFVRGAGHLLRSWPFWACIVLMLVALNVVDLVDWLGQAFRGRFTTTRVSPQRVSLTLLQPAIFICGYMFVVAESATTIRLYRTELVHSRRGAFGSTSELAHARRDIERVHVGWLHLSIERRQSRSGLCRRVQLLTGRTREERQRVAAAIRAWLDERPVGL